MQGIVIAMFSVSMLVCLSVCLCVTQ